MGGAAWRATAGPSAPDATAQDIWTKIGTLKTKGLVHAEDSAK
jgi:hypothetical protein